MSSEYPNYIPEIPYETDDSGFVRAAFRIMACEDVIADLIESAGDIIAIDTDFHCRPGIYEIGATRTGIHVIAEPYGYPEFDHFGRMKPVSYNYKVKTALAELHPKTISERWYGEDKLNTLIAMMQKRDGTIRTYIFNNAQLLPMEMDVPWRGEGMAYPAAWRYQGGTIMETSNVK